MGVDNVVAGSGAEQCSEPLSGVQIQGWSGYAGQDSGQLRLTAAVTPHLRYCGWAGTHDDPLLLCNPQQGTHTTVAALDNQ